MFWVLKVFLWRRADRFIAQDWMKCSFRCYYYNVYCFKFIIIVIQLHNKYYLNQFLRGKGTIISVILIHQLRRLAVFLLKLPQTLQRNKYIQNYF